MLENIPFCRRRLQRQRRLASALRPTEAPHSCVVTTVQTPTTWTTSMTLEDMTRLTAEAVAEVGIVQPEVVGEMTVHYRYVKRLIHNAASAPGPDFR